MNLEEVDLKELPMYNFAGENGKYGYWCTCGSPENLFEESPREKRVLMPVLFPEIARAFWDIFGIKCRFVEKPTCENVYKQDYAFSNCDISSARDRNIKEWVLWDCPKDPHQYWRQMVTWRLPLRMPREAQEVVSMVENGWDPVDAFFAVCVYSKDLRGDSNPFCYERCAMDFGAKVVHNAVRFVAPEFKKVFWDWGQDLHVRADWYDHDYVECITYDNLYFSLHIYGDATVFLKDLPETKPKHIWDLLYERGFNKC